MTAARFHDMAQMVCFETKAQPGYYSAEKLSKMVETWPPAHVQLMKRFMSPESQPICFADVSIRWVGRILLDKMLNGQTRVWPTMLIQEHRLFSWQDDVEARTILGYLESNDMGLYITYGSQIEVRGQKVRLADFRVKFLKGYDYDGGKG